MGKKKTVIILVLAFVLLLGGAYTMYKKLSSSVAPNLLREDKNTQEDEAEENEKVLAPDFTVYDKDGEAAKLSDYVGKPIVLNFWASWCGPCKMEMPDFQAKYEDSGSEIQFLMVNMTDGSRETQESAEEFISDEGYTFPVLYDLDYNAATVYGVYSLPTTYFIDSEGYVIAQAKGALSAETLEPGIDMIKDD